MEPNTYTQISAEEAKTMMDEHDNLTLLDVRSQKAFNEGRRSKLAAQALADLGSTSIYEFGGIIDWPYDTVK